MARTAPYFTRTHEDPAVYHNQDDCPDGTQILGDNKVVDDPVNRSLCSMCAKRGYGHYTDWLATHTEDAAEHLDKKLAALQKRVHGRDEALSRIKAYDEESAEFAEIKAKRKALENKGKLTDEEAATLGALKERYGELYAALQAKAVQHKKDLDALKRLEGDEARHDEGQIKRAEAEVEVARRSRANCEEAATGLAKAHAAAIHGRSDPEKVELIADVVMNEARGQDPYVKKCLAYAYLNLTGGELRPPRGAEISYFTRSNIRFDDPKEGDPVQYIKSVAESLDAVRERLDDPNPEKTDPTGGANHWASPKKLSAKKRQEYDTKTGSYSWLNGAKKIVLKEIPEETFTFFKTSK